MLTRVIDFLKNAGITDVFASLTSGDALERTDEGISSLMDTWLMVRMIESSGERNRLLYVLKSRGMAHSNQMSEFVLSDKGISLVNVYVGPGAVLTGSARLQQEAKDRAATVLERQASQSRQRELQQEATTLRIQAEGIASRLESIESESCSSPGKSTSSRSRPRRSGCLEGSRRSHLCHGSVRCCLDPPDAYWHIARRPSWKQAITQDLIS